ncbi:hypothetical protein Q672_00305 [Marinobacter sp. EVN1]|uniref:3-deoxy-D-manno-octulosonic acid kinase n=1 Tax=Marinobacter sp. EVN1 TaxID=1397532 RepID=UPI0003B88092|nr:3-deoxy-D-manno-octulosonic acid kinase [Marinobacter sp. EVN1]ERS88666.1 hypothetical protein Q672_00305 [Marinobacter sp. EVN1]
MTCERANDQYVTKTIKSSSYLIRSEYSEKFQFRWFQASFWQNSAQLIASGGRGSAWFIANGRQSWVLRHYKRGGVIARFVSSYYLYFGKRNSRPFREFRVLCWLYSAGFPVPKPVAAQVSRCGFFYSGAIIVERLSNARPMGDDLQSLGAEVWRAVGKTIRSFHDAGVYHADLNCFNIMLRGLEVFLIDFDKARVFANAQDGSSARWKARNLARLKRSLYKVKSPGANGIVEEGWAELVAAYNHA